MSFLTPAPEALFFEGRKDDPRLGAWVKPRAKGLPPIDTFKKKKEICILFGSPDDEVVYRNRGRRGAQGGPNGIRAHLYKMTPPMDLEWENKVELWDFGNLIPAGDITVTHERAEEAARAISAAGGTLIALGGGHDFCAPHLKGFLVGQQERKKRGPSLALINVDPHLDMRPMADNGPNSGTPFRQILENKWVAGRNLVAFGTRPNRNSREHFAFAKSQKVKIRTWETLALSKRGVVGEFSLELAALSRQADLVAVTIDMDSCSDAEGTSAPPVLGFSAWELCQMAYLAGKNKKVKFFELAEAAPSLDFNERISRVGAEVIYFFLKGRAEAAT